MPSFLDKVRSLVEQGVSAYQQKTPNIAGGGIGQAVARPMAKFQQPVGKMSGNTAQLIQQMRQNVQASQPRMALPGIDQALQTVGKQRFVQPGTGKNVSVEEAFQNAVKNLPENITQVGPQYFQPPELPGVPQDVQGVLSIPGRAVTGLSKAYARGLRGVATQQAPMQTLGDVAAGAGALMSPLSGVTSGLFGSAFQGVMNKATGQPITQGMSEAFNQGQDFGFQANAVSGLTNPIISGALSRLPAATSGAAKLLINRLAPATANVAQGMAINATAGQESNPLGMAIDFGIGLLGGKGQFDHVPSTKGAVSNLVGGEKAAGWEEATNKFSNLMDQKPRFEIDDSGAKLNLDIDILTKKAAKQAITTPSIPVKFKLGEILDHKKLFSEYPDLKNVDVDVMTSLSSQAERANFDPKLNKITLYLGSNNRTKSSLLHEIQHAIQQKEDFARGGSIDQFIKGGQINPKTGQQVTMEEAYNMYRNLSGEIESRAVQRRMNMPENVRRGTDPYAAEMAATGISSPKEAITQFRDTTSNLVENGKFQEPADVPKIKPISNTPEVTQAVENSIKTADPTPLLSSYSNLANKTYTELVDRFHPLSMTAKAAGDEGTMRRALAGHYGAASTGTYHVDHELAPILKSANLNDIRELAIAQRDIELLGRDIKGSTSQGQADQIIGNLQQRLGPEKFSQVQKAVDNLHTYQDNIVKRYLVDTGVLSQEQYSAMRSKNQSYVPFQRVQDEMDTLLGVAPGKSPGSVSSQNVVKTIKGSTKEVIDPVESIIANTYNAVALGKSQEVARALVSFKDKLPEGVITKIEGQAADTPHISLFENGKKTYYKVPPEVAQAAKGMNVEQLNTLFKIANFPTKVFRATATGLNPEFALPNVFRDIQSAVVNIGFNPMRWVEGLSSLMKKDETYQQFLEAGGQTSRVSLDRPYLQEKVAEFAGKPNKPKGLEILRPRNIIGVLEKIGEYSEQPTRIAMFKQKFEEAIKYMPREEAMKEAASFAQEGTVNFSRMGSKMQPVNAVIAFLNARLQGTDRLFRSLKNDPKGAGSRLAAITLLPALALYANNHNYQSYNDPNVVSENDKNNNFILMFSDTPVKELGGAQYFKIPKGEVGKLANPVENFLSFAEGKGGDVQQSLLTALQSFSPVSNVGDVIPTAIKPLYEAQANYNTFTGRNIVSPYKTGLPPEAQYNASTLPVYRAAGQALQQSPAKLQHIIEGYGTGWAKIIGPSLNPLFPGIDMKDRGSADIQSAPIARRFAGGAKMSPEEVAAQKESTQKSIKMQWSQLKSAVKKGEITQDRANQIINQAAKDRGVESPTQISVPTQESVNPFVGKASAAMDTSQQLPTSKKTLRELFNQAKSVVDSYEKKRLALQYKKFDFASDKQDKIDKLEADKASAEEMMAKIQQTDPSVLPTREDTWKKMSTQERAPEVLKYLQSNEVKPQDLRGLVEKKVLTSSLVDAMEAQNLISTDQAEKLQSYLKAEKIRINPSKGRKKPKKVKMRKLPKLKPFKMAAFKMPKQKKTKTFRSIYKKRLPKL